jgi:hypothetical protein
MCHGENCPLGNVLSVLHGRNLDVEENSKDYLWMIARKGRVPRTGRASPASRDRSVIFAGEMQTLYNNLPANTVLRLPSRRAGLGTSWNLPYR